MSSEQAQTLPITVSGSVHRRELEVGGDISSQQPQAQRQRLLQFNENTTQQAYGHPHVLCYAIRNRNGRFYIPDKHNYIGGVQVAKVFLDLKCSSLFLPFPLEVGLPPEFMDELRFRWNVSSSHGVRAGRSLVLTIKKYIGSGFSCTLAGKEQPDLNFLRFHLGSQACKMLLQADDCHRMLDQESIEKIINFLGRVNGGDVLGFRFDVFPELTYALLGQSYIANLFFCQCNNIALVMSNHYNGSDNILSIIGGYYQNLEPMTRRLQFFDLCEDDSDSDSDDDE